MTAFGPQSANYTTTRPATDAVASGAADTWFKNCSGAGVMDGTIPTASWFNTVTGNLRHAATAAGVALDDTDDTMIWQAMQAAAATALGNLTASRGVARDTNDFQLTVGQGVDPVLTSAGIDPLNDKVIIFDASGTAVAEGTVYNLIKSVLSGIAGITFNDATGSIVGAAPRHFAQSGEPAGVNVHDTWWDTDSDVEYRRTTDGANTFWKAI